jgi:hypothetical protein
VLLPIAIDSTIPLFKAVGIPGQLKMNYPMAVLLEV